MKREVIFRGWSPTDGKWIYGSGVHSTPFRTYLLTDAGRLLEVEPETVGEWTGESSNELGFRRIYEGDFVITREVGSPKFNGPFFVHFAGHAFEMLDYSGESFPLTPWNTLVLGNATENPELHDVETKIRTLEEFRNMI